MESNSLNCLASFKDVNTANLIYFQIPGQTVLDPDALLSFLLMLYLSGWGAVMDLFICVHSDAVP